MGVERPPGPIVTYTDVNRGAVVRYLCNSYAEYWRQT